jgi:hypothetical protein
MDIGLIVGGLMIFSLVVAWLWEKIRAKYPKPEQPERNKRESQIWPADPYGKQECVIDAAAIANQRKSGRWLGPDIVVYWRPGVDWEVDNHGVWLEQHGRSNGVYVKRIGNAKPLASPTRRLP